MACVFDEAMHGIGREEEAEAHDEDAEGPAEDETCHGAGLRTHAKGRIAIILPFAMVLSNREGGGISLLCGGLLRRRTGRGGERIETCLEGQHGGVFLEKNIPPAGRDDLLNEGGEFGIRAEVLSEGFEGFPFLDGFPFPSHTWAAEAGIPEIADVLRATGEAAARSEPAPSIGEGFGVLFGGERHGGIEELLGTRGACDGERGREGEHDLDGGGVFHRALGGDD